MTNPKKVVTGDMSDSLSHDGHLVCRGTGVLFFFLGLSHCRVSSGKANRLSSITDVLTFCSTQPTRNNMQVEVKIETIIVQWKQTRLTINWWVILYKSICLYLRRSKLIDFNLVFAILLLRLVENINIPAISPRNTKSNA